MMLRKFLGLVFTSLLTGLFLNFVFAITNGLKLFLALGVLLAGTFPFVLLIGVPVSFLSDYLTRDLTGKQRYKKAFIIYIFFGLIAGLVISFFFESLLLVGVTLIASSAFLFSSGTIGNRTIEYLLN